MKNKKTEEPSFFKKFFGLFCASPEEFKTKDPQNENTSNKQVN